MPEVYLRYAGPVGCAEDVGTKVEMSGKEDVFETLGERMKRAMSTKFGDGFAEGFDLWRRRAGRVWRGYQ